MPNSIWGGRRISSLCWAGWLSVLSVCGLALVCVTLTAIGTVLVSVGIPVLLVCLPLLRRLADLHRQWASALLGIELPSPYRPQSASNRLVVLWEQAGDPASWRDLGWLIYNSTVGLAIYLAAFVYGLFALVFWFLPPNVLLVVNAWVASKLLSPSRSWYLTSRVQHLVDSRAETIGTGASEIRRIERDLHDGAQAKLVALGINLGMAEQIIDTDPAAARQLLVEARATTGAALVELRDLVRGIHPPVLADRGLLGAVQALALASPIPVEVVAALPGRLAAPVESAAYFAVAEALTNVIKHGQARRVGVLLQHQGNLLLLQVVDDGIGGAQIDAGTGLRGIERRLAAFDGTLVVTSPAGGPTTVTMELPCASSLPKTTLSSGTD
ncbi:MAG: sensor domain-containing protein [Actinomycetota bacterium]|nr:sensor domain-containing protein [Actinomycetota bacterium]